jgi:hypothetical protein
MNEITTARMLMTTAVLAAVAALFAGGANAMLMDVDGGGTTNGAVTAPTAQPFTIPYVSHGIGVDESLFTGRSRETQATFTVEPSAIPYLSQGVGVDESQFSGLPSLGLTGDSALTRVSAPEPEGLTGDSALTRYPGTVTLPTSSGGNDLDWTSFGAGAGMAAVLAAAIGGIWLTSRRRGGVALP